MTPRLHPRLCLRAACLAAAGLFALGGSPAARATDLLETWTAARSHDPTFAAARAAHDAGALRRDEARALWRPAVAIEGGASVGGAETATRGAQFSAPGFGTSSGVSFDTSVTRGTATQFGLSVHQPLYSRELDARARELRVGADAADVEWTQAEQDLVLRSVEAYFGAALAAERLRVLEAQQVAVDRALAEAKDRFQAGDRPVTSVHEATARAKGLAAQRLGARIELASRRAALADLAGPTLDVTSLRLPVVVREADPGPLADWLVRVDRAQPALRLAQAQMAAAQARADGVAGALSPTAELVAQLGRERLAGDGDFGTASNTSRQAAIGVRVSVPLYTGGLRSAQSSQALARIEEARARVDAARQQAEQQARDAWLALSIGAERLDALAAAREAGRARLDATRTGLQAGDRTTLDLLNAENDTAAADLALTEARVQLLTQRLRLAALAGELDDAALRRANDALDPPR
jgi:outer membrane protein